MIYGISMNLNPFVNLINNFVTLYEFALVVWLIVTMLVRFNIVNDNQSLVKYLIRSGYSLFEPVLSKLRKFLPHIAGIDLSPVALFFLLNFIKEFLLTYLYKI